MSLNKKFRGKNTAQNNSKIPRMTVPCVIGVSAISVFTVLAILATIKAASLKYEYVPIFNCTVLDFGKVESSCGPGGCIYHRRVTVEINNRTETDETAACPDVSCPFSNGTAYCFWIHRLGLDISVSFSLAAAKDAAKFHTTGFRIFFIILAVAAFVTVISISVYTICHSKEECKNTCTNLARRCRTCRTWCFRRRRYDKIDDFVMVN